MEIPQKNSAARLNNFQQQLQQLQTAAGGAGAGNSDRNFQIDQFENQQINTLQDGVDDIGRINISQIDATKRLSECQSLLEFAITGLSKNLNLKPKQAVGLLANNNKYLAVGLVKGLKTSFQPLSDWLQSVYVNIKTVLGFIEQNSSDLFRFLDMVKPGLQSSNESVSLWASRIVSKVSFEMSNTDIIPQVYQWFVRENGGLQSCIFCLKRHKVIMSNVVQIITQIARYNLSDLFVVQLRKLFENIQEYISFVAVIFPGLIEINNCKEELLQNRILDYWVEQAQKMADYDPIKNSVSIRQVSLKFLCECWIAYPTHLQENLQVSNQLLDMLKKGSRDYSEALKIHSLGLLFYLLENFAKQRNTGTALIYKKLIFSLIENSSDTNLREFMLQNFSAAFKRFSSMPPEILLDPFVKQIQLRQSGNIFLMNVCDIEFFITISKHPSLTMKTAIQLLDMLAKTYLNELVWSQSLASTIKSLVDKFIENEAFQEYLQKLSEVALQMVRDSYKRLLQPPGRFQQDYTTEQEQVILEAQRRALVVEMMKGILECKVISLNNSIKKYIIQAQQELLASGIQYKGIYTLLLFFGDPNEVVEAYKNEELANQKDFEYNLFKLQQGKKQKKEVTSAHQSNNEIIDQLETDRKMSKQGKNVPKIDWNQAEDIVESVQLKYNNYTAQASKPGESQDATPGSPQKPHPNTYGANRMDFSEYEDTLMKEFNKKSKEAKRGREERTRGTSIDNYVEKSIPQKTRIQTENQRSVSIGKRGQAGTLERRREELELIKEKREKKLLLEDLERMQRAQKDQQLKRLTENEVVKIHTKLNVAKNKQTDQSAKIVYRENELDSLRDMIKYKIIDVNELDDRDKDSLEIVVKQYANAFKFVFHKYCNAHKTFNKNVDSFQDKKQVAELISFADIWNCCKDYDLQKLVSKEDVQNLMKQVNSNPPFTFLKYVDFIQLVLQLSFFIFRAPPRDFRGFPLGQSVRELFKIMAIFNKRRGENAAIFENPECCVGNIDVNSIKQWNAKLLKDPDISVPENLRKVTEKTYTLTQQFDDRYLFGLSKGYSLAYQIVADIMKEKFGVSMLENTMKILAVCQARPKPIPQLFSKGRQNINNTNSNNNDGIFGLNEAENEQSTQLQRNTSPNGINKSLKQNMSVPNIRGNSTLKGGNMKNNDQYQSLWVQKYSQYGLAGIQKEKTKVVNQAILEKQKKEEEDIKAREAQDKRIRERQLQLHLLKKEFESHKEKKKEEKKEEEQKQQQEKEKQREKQDQQRREQLRRKEEMLNQKEQEGLKKLKEKEESLRQQLEQEMKSKLHQSEFKQKQSKQVNVHLDQIKEKKVAKEEDKAKEQEKLENQKKIHQQKNEKARQTEKARKENAENIKNAQLELEQSSEVAEVFEKSNKQLATLFNSYKIYKDPRNKQSSTNPSDILSFNGFSHICSHFKISPDIISSEEVKAFYKASLRENDGNASGIKLEQLQNLLVKIATKSQPYFDSIAASRGGAKSQNQIEDPSLVEQVVSIAKNQIIKPKLGSQNYLKNNQEQQLQQELNNIKATSATTVQGVIYYLDLPIDKNMLLSKIKAFQGDKAALAEVSISAGGHGASQSLSRGNSAQQNNLRDRSKGSIGARSQTNSIEPIKKYPKSKKYKNVQSKFKNNKNGDIFTNATSVGSGQKGKSESEVNKSISQ